jgi:hypothetical protein
MKGSNYIRGMLQMVCRLSCGFQDWVPFFAQIFVDNFHERLELYSGYTSNGVLTLMWLSRLATLCKGPGINVACDERDES